VLDEWRQGAHGGALGAEGGELVAVCEEESRPGVRQRWGHLWPGSGETLHGTWPR
jgi:hypothetical protein